MEQIETADEVIISYYLNMMINSGKSWPNHFLGDVDANVYNWNPWLYLNRNPWIFFVFVRSRTEACGRTDGCESGCWRIIGRDKLIKTEETGKFLGFKKILRFCEKWKTRPEEEDQRIWVMEEYRLVDKWKQDQVICKIRLLLRPAVSSLLAKHFSFLPKWIRPRSRRRLLPRWYFRGPRIPEDETISYYLKMMVDNRNAWPRNSLQSEQVYGVVPWSLMYGLQSSRDLQEGPYFFVNRTAISGKTDGCARGCWRIIRRDKVITSQTNKILGFKRVFKFCDSDSYKFDKPIFKLTWIMEEYRLAKKRTQGKVICRIKLLDSTLLRKFYSRD